MGELGRRKLIGAGVSVAIFATLGLSFSAIADENIGATVLTHNQVTREIAGAAGPLAVGDVVFRDEGVRTAAASTAKLVFLDSTNLAVGPLSRVVLDRFVYDAAPSGQAVGVNLAKGVFRFTTGVLNKGAYSITTPNAAIGVRGTVLDFAVSGKRSLVTLVEGRAILCPRGPGEAGTQRARDCTLNPTRACGCVELDRAGQSGVVKGAAGAAHAEPSSVAVQFASLCSGSGGLCSASASTAASNITLASTPVEAPAIGGSLCGR